MKSKINYVYFGMLFLLLALLAASSVFTKENLVGAQPFFFLYALGQVALEITLLIGLSLLIERYFGKFWFSCFIGLTFVILFLHIFDFLMDRVLDLSIWEAFEIFVWNESFSNFFYLLDASGVSLWIWLAFFAFLTCLPLMGVFFYRMTDKIAEKKSFFLPHSYFIQSLLCIPMALIFWDFSASRVIHPDAYSAFQKSLPWKGTFLQPENVHLTFSAPLKKPMSEEEIAKAIAASNIKVSSKPNIYLFITESLREDVITEEVAPHLYQFKNSYSHFETPISNGNGTHISWFSIFHSQFPYHWKEFQQLRKKGSPALQLLKKWGYQIRLYTSAQLSYYGMEELLFGEGSHLLHDRQTFHHTPPSTAAESDGALIEKLQKDVETNPRLKRGQVFLIFLDSTHFNYSWPKNWIPRFTPFAKEFTYFKAFQSKKTIQNIKNRYKNSVHYIDSLFGRFFQKLPNPEEAIVIFTGDHGEEFFEHGHLFHNSHLTREQTQIPLYFKIGEHHKDIFPHKIASQMDIFPTLLDYLSGAEFSFLEGNSLFKERLWPYVVTARFNGGSTPYQFSLHNGRYKLIAEFRNRSRIFDEKELQVISLRTYDDKSLTESNVEFFIHEEFGEALNHLFR